MAYLNDLRAARTLTDVARILRVQPKTVSFLLYKLSESEKYHSFEILKRSGGKRLINAPEPRLKMVQRRLANVLYGCIAEIEKIEKEKNGSPRHPLAHGFSRARSIFTNASVHKNRRYVLNLDLEDFFPTLNFGRVRGFFIKDSRFELNEKVATVIAQVACFNNELPQGSPCSPIISNLIGHLLDVRLARFAKKNRCTYSRYADDITFSTNQKNFPAALAKPRSEKSPQWQLGVSLVKEIENSDFKINHGKTRMQWRGSRQVTTGLIVNEKVNIRSEYYRTARTICNKLFSTGEYYESNPDTPVKSLDKIEGILNHIYYIKDRSDRREEKEKKEKPIAIRRLYRRFLFYKNFVALKKPLIVTEGKTDPIYLRLAVLKLTDYYPKLGKIVDGKFSCAVRFMKYSDTVQKILQLGGGTGALKNHLILKYSAEIRSFKFAPLDYPVIIVIDNDDGAKDIFKVVKNKIKLTISHQTDKPFYHLDDNLYLVKTPENGAKCQSCIEDMFDKKWHDLLLDGKSFDPSNESGREDTYGKVVFARKVVIPHADEIDFSQFGKLLERIVAALEHYEKRKSSSRGL